MAHSELGPVRDASRGVVACAWQRGHRRGIESWQILGKGVLCLNACASDCDLFLHQCHVTYSKNSLLRDGGHMPYAQFNRSASTLLLSPLLRPPVEGAFRAALPARHISDNIWHRHHKGVTHHEKTRIDDSYRPGGQEPEPPLIFGPGRHFCRRLEHRGSSDSLRQRRRKRRVTSSVGPGRFRGQGGSQLCPHQSGHP